MDCFASPASSTPHKPRAPWWVALALASTLSGCAHVVRLEQDVQAHAQWETPTHTRLRPAPGDLFGFVRRPSQSDTASQGALEQAAAAALAQVGLRWDAQRPAGDATPVRWWVEFNARVTTLPASPWAPVPRPRRAWVAGVGVGHGPIPPWGPLGLPPSPPYYLREVSLSLREATSGQVVYESTASHDGPWPTQSIFWGALFDAALRGFPDPPAGVQRVVTEIVP